MLLQRTVYIAEEGNLMSDLKLVLVDPRPVLCTEWREQFADLPNVEIVNGYFEELDRCLRWAVSEK
jgi:hypothetical protein